MRFYKITIILLTVIFVSFFSSDTDSSILSQTGFYSGTDEIINKLDNSSAGYREHFLLGIAYKKKGEQKKAIFHFANSCFKYSRSPGLKLYPYTVFRFISGFHVKSEYYSDAAYEIASLFFGYREYEYVPKFTDLVSKNKTALYRDAVILKSKALVESGKADNAILLLKGILPLYADSGSAALILIRAGSAYERKKDIPGAIGEYLGVLKLSAKSWQAGVACDRIIDIISGNTLELDDKDRFLLAVSLYHNSKKGSSEILEDLLRKELNDPLKSDVLKYLIRSFVKDGKPGAADRLILQYRDDPVYQSLLKTQADELWAANKKLAAYNIYRELYNNSQDEISRESHKRIIQYLVKGNAAGQEKIIIEFKDKYPEDKASEYFLWCLARLKLKVRDSSAAVLFMEELLSRFPDGPYSARSRYWLAKLYSGSREEDSMRMVREMAVFNPNSPYTWKKLAEIKDKYNTGDMNNKFNEAILTGTHDDALFYHAVLFAINGDTPEKHDRVKSAESIEDVKRYKSFESDLNNIRLDSIFKENLKWLERYFAIGYYDGIIRELDIIPDSPAARKDKHMMLANLGEKYNQYYFSSTSMIKLLKYYNLKENITLMTRATINKLLPKAFSSLAGKDCGEMNIPEEMAYAVMKTESSFNHRAVSPVGAVGLMQLMPDTAKDIAKRIKISEFDLKDPATSINFGVRYLSWLNKMFSGNFTNMIAGYNAGAGNVIKWVKEFNTPDNDYFIEFIPFDETKNYVLQADKFYIQYKLINQ